jgi:extracellular factor (EF) 3-hydroxypalmitic acid methyl ester biosynthesis protein
MCAPIVHRTFTKPLGYAGDYAMVDMIVGDPALGANTYAKLINVFNVSTPPAIAHRNRIEMLVRQIDEEARRVSRQDRPLKILNIGCGPALELQRFIANSELSARAEFTLMDFSEETLAHARDKLTTAQKTGGRTPEIEYLHQSIHGLLKEALQRRANPEKTYDLIYCAGLFDYLSDRICRRLLQLFYAWTNPGGLVIATNVHPSNPARHYMEHILEWYLIHRDEKHMALLAPKGSRYDFEKDATGVNVFLRVRLGE